MPTLMTISGVRVVIYLMITAPLTCICSDLFTKR
jgi:hypothetical protein